MNTYHILGNGGFAREVAGILYAHGEDVTMFVDGELSAIQQALIANWENITYVGVGSPKLKKKWASTLKDTTLKTPYLIDPMVRIRDYNKSTKIGQGSIICAGTIITTNVTIGEFVTINLNCTVGHDSVIGSYTTLAPGCNISGNVRIGKCCDIGSNVTIIPGVTLPDGGIIGAGSVVTKSINISELKIILSKKYIEKAQIDGATTDIMFQEPTIESYTMVGSPARVIKINNIRV